MATYLTRKEYVKKVYYYHMLVDSVMAQQYADYINRTYLMEHDGPIVLTEQDIVNAWDGDLTEGVLSVRIIRDIEYDANYCCTNLTVGDILRDLLSSDIWDQEVEEGEASTEYVDDCITTSYEIK